MKQLPRITFVAILLTSLTLSAAVQAAAGSKGETTDTNPATLVNHVNPGVVRPNRPTNGRNTSPTGRVRPALLGGVAGYGLQAQIEQGYYHQEQGSSVAVSGDGNTFLMGEAKNTVSGEAQGFTLSGSTWTLVLEFLTDLTRAVALSANGTVAVVGDSIGGSATGAVGLSDTAGNWASASFPTPAGASQNFGAGVTPRGVPWIVVGT